MGVFRERKEEIAEKEMNCPPHVSSTLIAVFLISPVMSTHMDKIYLYLHSELIPIQQSSLFSLQIPLGPLFYRSFILKIVTSKFTKCLLYKIQQFIKMSAVITGAIIII